MLRCKIVSFGLVSLIIVLAIPQSINAQFSGPIFIGADGSVIGTDKIQRNGNIYSLTDNLNITPIIIVCNNIVLDGKGFSLQAMSGWSEFVAINLTCTNVTVRNFNITNYGVGILGAWDNNSITNNTFTNVIKAIAICANNYTINNNTIQKSTYGIRILNGNNNCFFNNQLIENCFGFRVTNSSRNLAVANNFENNKMAFSISSASCQVYHNNFINQYIEVNNGAYSAVILSDYSGSNLWDNSYPSGGNYYSDYLSRYPNASEINNSGIGNIPYQVSINSNLTDRYPLLTQVNILVPITQLPSPSTIASLSSPTPTSSSPTQTPTLSPSPTAYDFKAEDYTISIILYSSIALIVVIGLLFYFRHRKMIKAQNKI